MFTVLVNVSSNLCVFNIEKQYVHATYINPFEYLHKHDLAIPYLGTLPRSAAIGY